MSYAGQHTKKDCLDRMESQDMMSYAGQHKKKIV